MSMYKLLSIAVLLTITMVVNAQEKNTSTDGPYVFYQGDKVYVKSIVEGNVVTDSFPAKEKTEHPLTVQVAGHPEWQFNVVLRDSIVPRACIYPASDKIIFVSDIEGEFEAFRSLMIGNKVMDNQGNWIFGSNRLVVAGDLFDRGKQVPQYIWLLYKLEYEARLSGGDVHVVLGNHDIMNMKGDLRYVQPVYFKNAELLQQSYNSLYDANTELGRWLRSKNLMEKIGDFLVLHGGISPEVVEKKYNLERISKSCRPFYDWPTKKLPDSVKVFLGNKGLFWYRDYFSKHEDQTTTIDSACFLYGVKQIIVGHTINKPNIAFYHDYKVLALDVNEHEGDHAVALWIKGKWYVTGINGKRKRIQLATSAE